MDVIALIVAFVALAVVFVKTVSDADVTGDSELRLWHMEQEQKWSVRQIKEIRTELAKIRLIEAPKVTRKKAPAKTGGRSRAKQD